MDDIKIWLLSAEAFLCVFLLALVILWLVLLKFFPQDTVFWKRVDYVWLLMAVLGGVAAINQNRLIVAKSIYETQQLKVLFARGKIQQQLNIAVGSFICMPYEDRSDRPQEVKNKAERELADQCSWFRRAKKRFESVPLDKAITDMGENENYPYPVGSYWQMYTILKQYVADYNDQEKTATKLKAEASPTFIDDVLKYFGPFIVALALALRYLKAVVDVELEKPKRATRVLGPKMLNYEDKDKPSAK